MRYDQRRINTLFSFFSNTWPTDRNRSADKKCGLNSSLWCLSKKTGMFIFSLVPSTEKPTSLLSRFKHVRADYLNEVYVNRYLGVSCGLDVVSIDNG